MSGAARVAALALFGVVACAVVAWIARDREAELPRLAALEARPMEAAHDEARDEAALAASRDEAAELPVATTSDDFEREADGLGSSADAEEFLALPLQLELFDAETKEALRDGSARLHRRFDRHGHPDEWNQEQFVLLAEGEPPLRLDPPDRCPSRFETLLVSAADHELVSLRIDWAAGGVRRVALRAAGSVVVVVAGAPDTARLQLLCAPVVDSGASGPPRWDPLRDHAVHLNHLRRVVVDDRATGRWRFALFDHDVAGAPNVASGEVSVTAGETALLEFAYVAPRPLPLVGCTGALLFGSEWSSDAGFELPTKATFRQSIPRGIGRMSAVWDVDLLPTQVEGRVRFDAGKAWPGGLTIEFHGGSWVPVAQFEIPAGGGYLELRIAPRADPPSAELLELTRDR